MIEKLSWTIIASYSEKFTRLQGRRKQQFLSFQKYTQIFMHMNQSTVSASSSFDQNFPMLIICQHAMLCVEHVNAEIYKSQLAKYYPTRPIEPLSNAYIF